MVLFLLVISILDIFLEVLIGKCTRKRPELLLSISLLLHSPSLLVLFLRPLFFSLLLQSLSASPPSFRIPSSSSFTRSFLALLPHSLSIETHSVFHRLSSSFISHFFLSLFLSYRFISFASSRLFFPFLCLYFCLYFPPFLVHWDAMPHNTLTLHSPSFSPGLSFFLLLSPFSLLLFLFPRLSLPSLPTLR